MHHQACRDESGQRNCWSLHSFTFIYIYCVPLRMIRRKIARKRPREAKPPRQTFLEQTVWFICNGSGSARRALLPQLARLRPRRP